MHVKQGGQRVTILHTMSGQYFNPACKLLLIPPTVSKSMAAILGVPKEITRIQGKGPLNHLYSAAVTFSNTCSGSQEQTTVI